MQAVILYALFAAPGGDWPSEYTLAALDALPRFAQRGIVRQFERAGLHFPEQEFVDYDGTFGASFRGAVVVFYRRAIGKRLPRDLGDPLSPPDTPQPESP